MEGVELLEKTPIPLDDENTANGKEMEKAPLDETELEKGNEYSESPLPAGSAVADEDSKA